MDISVGVGLEMGCTRVEAPLPARHAVGIDNRQIGGTNIVSRGSNLCIDRDQLGRSSRFLDSAFDGRMPAVHAVHDVGRTRAGAAGREGDRHIAVPLHRHLNGRILVVRLHPVDGDARARVFCGEGQPHGVALFAADGGSGEYRH